MMYEVSFWYGMQWLEAFADTAVIDWLHWLYQLALPIGSAHWLCQSAVPIGLISTGCTALHVIVDQSSCRKVLITCLSCVLCCHRASTQSTDLRLGSSHDARHEPLLFGFCCVKHQVCMWLQLWKHLLRSCNNSNDHYAFQLMMTSLVSPEQLVLGIPIRLITTVLTMT